MNRRQTSDLSQQTSGVGRPAAPARRGAPPSSFGVRTSACFNAGRTVLGCLSKSAPGGAISSRRFLLSLILPWLLLLPFAAHAQTFPLALNQDLVNYNPHPAGGLPLSNEAGNPVGSDGRGPAADATLGVPADSQWRGVVTFGHVLKRVKSSIESDTYPYDDNPAVFPNDTYRNESPTTPKFVLQRATVGAPYIARSVSFLIGSVIPPPDTDENDVALDGVEPEDYWFLKPDEADSAANKYYWSPHANSVFAVEPGNTTVVWVKREPGMPADATEAADTTKWLQSGSSYFRKYSQTYLVSGSAIKGTQKIYWNSVPFAGPAVALPSSRVGDVHFAYYASFPEHVNYEEDTDGNVLVDEANIRLDHTTFTFTNTIWLDTVGNNSQIRVQNVEGRIFMEILGDVVGSDGSTDIREHLGFEILDVVKYPSPGDKEIELGEVITSGSTASGADGWLPRPLDEINSRAFYYSQSVADGTLPILYAKAETGNQNDLLIHWMQEGVEGIRWPALFVRYTLRWPTDVAKYSHYVRPAATNEDEAKATAVPLYARDVPQIVYQDILGGVVRAKLTEDTRFYTILDAAYPAHRTLLQYNSGDYVAFERVFSWLDTSLLSLSELEIETGTFVTDATAAVTFESASVRPQTDINDEIYNFKNPIHTVVADGIAYVAGLATDNLTVLDVSDPKSPKVIREINKSTEFLLDGAWHITLNGGYLYLTAVNGDAISIFDVSKLTNSTDFTASEALVATLNDGDESTELNSPRCTAIHEGTYNGIDKRYLYVVAHDNALVIFDVTDPTIPVFKSSKSSFSSYDFFRSSWIEIADGFAYVAVSTSDGSAVSSSILILDVATDPENPAFVHRIVDGSDGFDYLNGIEGLLVSDGLLYIAATGDDTVTIVDVGYGTGSPSFPKELAELRDDVYSMDGPRRMAINNYLLFIPAGESDVVNIFDISDPSKPVLLQKVEHSADGEFNQMNRPYAVAVDGDFAFVSGFDSSALTIFGFPANAVTQTIVTNLVADAFADTVANNLASFNSDNQFEWSDSLTVPRVVYDLIEVGKRIVAPDGESGSGSGDDYLAAHINQTVGTSFNPDAYIDPLNSDNEFETANLGAIIPVNAVPGANELEVWWLRSNGADTAAGFHTAHWPAIIGRYTLGWPSDPPEIVLASNDGSGALDSLAATGDIYYQNDSALPGYNPNEEHAIMSGGQAFALRDDLNLTGTATPAILTGTAATYSSDPFVLLEYTESDGRPAMIAFKVLREKPDAGITFEYDIDAGTVLQGPMPLTLLSGVNEEPIPPLVVESTFDSTSLESVLTVSERPEVEPFEGYLLQGGLTGEVEGFYVSTVNHDTKQVAGYVTIGGVHEIEHRQFAAWRMNQHAINPVVRVEVFNGSGIPVELVEAGDKVLLISPAEGRAEVFDLIDTADNRLFVLLPDASTSAQDVGALETATQFVFLKKDLAGNDFASTDAVSWLLTSTVAVDPADAAAYAAYTLADRKGNRWVYRGPHDAADGDRFRVQYHYETLDGFYFPGESTQPSVGTRTPYLRSYDTNAAAYVGGAYDGAADAVSALSITYIPIWPTDAPELHRGETLTLARRGLPAMRGNSSLEIVYDQALATSDLANKSVILHDPTREKEHELGTTNTVDGIDYVLAELPASIATSTYNGDTFFPNLPPHLSDRFLLDPNRGSGGALVFKGQFFEETVGEDYVMLNVAGAKDLETLYGLCDSADENYGAWTNAINNLKAVAEVFIEDPAVSGTFIASSTVQAKLDAGDYVNDPDASKTQTRDLAEARLAAVEDRYRSDGLVSGFTGYIGDLMEVTDDDVAVDSYALTATGPGTGYVSVLAGNGEAFTQTDDPVSILILKVVDTWHPGEVKVVLSSNPLSEKVTVQQVVDLAGEARNVDTGDQPLYAFDWRLAAPEDGLAPDVFNYQVATLWNNGTWTHVPLPTHSDTVSGIATTATERTTTVSGSAAVVTVLESITLSSEATTTADGFQITVDNRIANFAQGNLLEVTDSTGAVVVYSVTNDSSTGVIDVELSAGGNPVIDVASVVEAREADIPQSYLYSEFEAPEVYSELWFSLNLGADLGARVYLNGTEVIIAGLNDVDTNLTDTVSATPPDGLDPDFNPVGTTYLVSRDVLTTDGTPNQVVVALFTTEDAVVGASETFQLKIEALEYVDIAAGSTKWLAMGTNQFLDGIRAIIGGTADVQSLSDQHVIMRYGPANPAYVATDSVTNAATEWSDWTEPQLVEGWIKRVLAGINPFNQRTTDLFNNAVDTDASMLTLAGARWEGDVALNSDTINDYGLIEIYETVLNRGKGLSIDSGINYGPANDALLLAAGYINDLYMFIGNEALADALNPTIGIGTADGQYGDIATALFAFKGQTATLLEEELALLRGRDDFLPPGVEATPVYNRMFWNYTRGIDSGEVIYALNYNIQEDNNGEFDGVINADDAAIMFPQGHGDAYGHYLTALKGYFSLLVDADFDWVPRTESVTILGQTVQVDYTDERKFATAAAAVAKAGKQVFDLTWRQDYQSGADVGWEHFGTAAERSNDERLTTRYWGADHWASRTGQGAFLNWVAGNAMLPEIDEDPEHEGIQVIDRTTVPELAEIADVSRELQSAVDSADAHLNPLGLSEGSVAFDIRPLSDRGKGIGNETHFEQIYDRAKQVLNNAVVAFDDAKGVTQLMRSETDSLAEFQASVDGQEIAFTNALIEIYGTPYADDIGVGQTYATGYEGPDLLHYMYVDDNEIAGPAVVKEGFDISIDLQNYTDAYHDLGRADKLALDFIKLHIPNADDSALTEGTDGDYITYHLNSHGFFEKPESWSGKRESPGKLQSAISDIIKARSKASFALRNQEALKYELDRMIQVYEAQQDIKDDVRSFKEDILVAETILKAVKFAQMLFDAKIENTKSEADAYLEASKEAYPELFVFGLANGTDPSVAGFANAVIDAGVKSGLNLTKFIYDASVGSYELGIEEANTFRDFYDIAPKERQSDKLDAIFGIDMKLGDVQMALHGINQAIQELADANSRYRKLMAEGNRLQAEREVARRRTAALTQGYRTRDAAFRIFRDEKLERYNTLFALAARYAFLSAKAFDYETGLLNTDQGMDFINQIVASRALGVVAGGEPQFAGSDTGDPGLSSALAKMRDEWQVLKGRLGLNNPDIYGTTVSLRTENFRIFPGSDGDYNWRDILEAGRRSNLLEDDDVARHCLQIDQGDGLPVPGLVIEFSTQITEGNNLFGQPLAGGDHAYDISSFATKIFSAGIVLEGYNGMDNPSANTSSTGGSSTADPSAVFLEPTALSATPHVYLIPVGLDAMRSPALGDQSVVRTWAVEDVTIPLPFNIGGSDFSTKQLYQAADSLTEDLFSIRKHQAFRPVSDASVFVENGSLLPSMYTNNRLISRSVWNTKWKLVIPGRTLLNDPEQGLNILIDTLSDIKLHFETYSYSGN